MENDFLKEISSLNIFQKLRSEFHKSLKSSNVFYSSVLFGSSKSILISLLQKEFDQIILLLPNRQQVNELHVELSIIGLEDKLVQIDSIEIESIQERLTTIRNRKKSIIVSTYDLLKVKLPDKDEIEKSTTKLEVGTDITYDDLVEYLTELNYNSDKFVADPGYFAVRGSIIDFGPTVKNILAGLNSMEIF